MSATHTVADLLAGLARQEVGCTRKT